MAFFGSKKREQPAEREELSPKAEEAKKTVAQKSTSVGEARAIISPPSDAAMITGCVTVRGNTEGCGSLVIRGTHEGDIRMDDVVVVDHNAIVKGNITADKIKISGNVEGSLHCKVLEVTPRAEFKGAIHGERAYVDGHINGMIHMQESIEILSSGHIDSRECKSKKVRVVGKLNGRVIASELLEVVRGGSIEGEIITKGIKTQEGGTVIGSIQTYDDKLHGSEHPIPAKEVTIDIDPEIAKLIKIAPDDMKKYARKEKREGNINSEPRLVKKSSEA